MTVSKSVLIAPDSFKETLAATQVAESIREGWLTARPTDKVTCLPMADGGEGTLAALLAAVPGAVLKHELVLGPDSKEVEAPWLLLSKNTAVIELAAASGIELLQGELQPVTAHTFGLGQLIVAALKNGVTKLFITVGSSASQDGGAGALRALGAKILGDNFKISSVDFSDLISVPEEGAEVWCDVTNPLLGPSGAVSVYGPQKGVTAELKPLLESRLASFADVVELETGRNLRDIPGVGAAGGTAFGLVAWGATLKSGSKAISNLLNLSEKIQNSDIVITGEGRLDGQSFNGKVLSEVVRLSAQNGKKLGIIAGSIRDREIVFANLRDTGSIAEMASLEEYSGSLNDAMVDPQKWLIEAAKHLVTSL